MHYLRLITHFLTILPVLSVSGITYSQVPDGTPASSTTFHALGDLPGGRTESCAISVSADGRVVTGWSASEYGNRAFRWTSDGGMTELKGDGLTPLVGHALSTDGETIVGMAESEGGTAAFRWHNGNADTLPAPNPQCKFLDAWGVSGDGRTIVGNCSAPGKSRSALIWQLDASPSVGDLGGMSESSEATAVSMDGTIVVGYVDPRNGPEAVVWRDRVLKPLGILPGGEHHSEARALTRDRAVIVGSSASAQGFEAVEWRDERMVALGGLSREHEFLSSAQGVSDRGDVIVGFAIDDRDAPQAVVWDRTNGIRGLKSILINDFAIDLENWRLESANAVSQDGRTIVGCGRNPGGQSEAWMVQLPAEWWRDTSVAFHPRLDAAAPDPNSPSQKQSPKANPRLGRGNLVLDGLLDPAGVAIGPSGHIWVADTGHGVVRRFDAQGNLILVLGTPGSGIQFDSPQGVAVADDGSIYVVDQGRNRVVAISRDGRMRKAWGEAGKAAGQFQGPKGIAVRGGRVFVADTGNDRIQIFNESGVLLKSIGAFGYDIGELSGPAELAVDDQSRIYVADTGNDRVAVFDADGRWKTAWGERGAAPGLFNRPTGIAVRGENVYVVDQANHRIQVFNREGSLRYLWGREVLRPHESGGRISFPSRIAVSPDQSQVVISEPVENRCQTFGMIEVAPSRSSSAAIVSSAFYDALPLMQVARAMHVNGETLVTVDDANGYVFVYRLTDHDPVLVTKVGTSGHGPGQFGEVHGLCFDGAASQLFVADTGNHRIQIFDVQLPAATTVNFVPNLSRLRKTIELPYQEKRGDEAHSRGRPVKLARSSDGTIAIIDENENRVVLLDHELQLLRVLVGSPDSPGEFEHPADIAFTRDGSQILVLDAKSPGIVAFDLHGAYIRNWGSKGDHDGEFIAPSAIHAGNDGFVYVSDRARNCIQKFDENGKFITQWGSTGVGAGEFFKPVDISQDSQGRIYVNDFGNRRIQVFNADGKFLHAIGSALAIHPTLSR